MKIFLQLFLFYMVSLCKSIKFFLKGVLVVNADRCKALTVNEFSGKAGNYDELYPWMVNEDYPLIIHELRREPFSSLLDCGCGTGGFLSVLSRNTPPQIVKIA